MTQPVLTALSKGSCAHSGQVTFVSSATKVMFDNGPPLLLGDKGVIAACAFTIPSAKPQPCVTALVVVAATKVLVEGQAVILKGSADICQSAEQIPQGTVSYSQVQLKVTAT